MPLSLRDISNRSASEIHQQFDIGASEARELFKYLWTKMTNGPNSVEIQKAITLIEEIFDV